MRDSWWIEVRIIVIVLFNISYYSISRKFVSLMTSWSMLDHLCCLELHESCWLSHYWLSLEVVFCFFFIWFIKIRVIIVTIINKPILRFQHQGDLSRSSFHRLYVWFRNANFVFFIRTLILFFVSTPIFEFQLNIELALPVVRISPYSEIPL